MFYSKNFFFNVLKRMFLTSKLMSITYMTNIQIKLCISFQKPEPEMWNCLQKNVKTRYECDKFTF